MSLSLISVVLGLLADCACRALDLAIIEETLSDPPLERRGLGVFVGLGEDATGFGVGLVKQLELELVSLMRLVPELM